MCSAEYLVVVVSTSWSNTWSFLFLVFDSIEEYAPGFKSSVVGRDILTPPDLEKTFGLTGGVSRHNSARYIIRNFYVARQPRPQAPVRAWGLRGAAIPPFPAHAIVHVLSILVTFHFRTYFMVQCLSTSYILRDRFKHSQTTELLSKDSICAAVELILVRYTADKAVCNSSKTSGSLGVFTTVLLM